MCCKKGSVFHTIPVMNRGRSKQRTIPGLDPSTKEDGNFPDIQRAGSLHEFLSDIHLKYGPIASFWYGKEYVVSTSSADLFKEQQHVHNRPPALFKLFEPMFGAKSITYANGENWRIRRNNYDGILSHDAVKKYYQTYQSISDNLSEKWSNLVTGNHIAVGEEMMAYSLKVLLLTLMGNTFVNEREVKEFRRNYDIMFSEMERQLTDIPAPDSDRMKAFHKARENIYGIVTKTVQHRKENPPKKGEQLLIDLIIDHADDEETLVCESLTYMVAGYHTTGYLLTWCFYFLATHGDVQDKVYKEILSTIGREEVDHSNINDLVYLRQVIDETFRCSVLAPWTARSQNNDSQLGGHHIPKNTPVIQALGVSLQDEEVWSSPKEFDPDRFKPENTRKRSTFSFKPFGVTGKRMCPGYRFSYAEATVCLVTLLRKFKVHMVDGQKIHRVYGFVTHPSEEVWITIEKR